MYVWLLANFWILASHLHRASFGSLPGTHIAYIQSGFDSNYIVKVMFSVYYHVYVLEVRKYE